MNPHLNRSRRQLLASGLAAAVALPVFSLQARAQGRPVLKAGDQKGGLRALLEAAGGLEGLGYDIQWSEFPAAAPLAEALNAAAVDSGPIGDAPLIFALAAGTRVKAIGANRSDSYGTAVLVRPDSPLKTAADLKGKSIATNRGSIGHYVTLKAITAAGLKPEEANIRFLAPADAKLALTQGSVDAWATWEPYTALAVLVSGRGLLPGLSYLAATDAAIAAKRPVLQDFLQRVVKAQLWSYRNVDAYSAALARIIGIPPEAAKLQFERRQQRWIPIDAQVIADQQGTADFYRQVGLIRQPLDVKGTFDTGFGVAG
ncbi:MAG: ABC transporter substrate-binding protein [Variovorax paradoxus]|nr:ABC transporter substrate-binding protein [Variovorax paradoxus]MBW8714582.1 ABC transporter substrate-binding protein [Variovorax paradoxus]